MTSKADTIASLRRELADFSKRASEVSGMSRAPRSSNDSDAEAQTLATEATLAAEALTSADAFQRILRWVSARERSSAYLRERLAKEGFGAEQIEEALDRACRVHAVDDRRYADALVRSKLAAGKGLREVEAEIADLGIDPASLDAWAQHNEMGREAEIERACALLKRRPPRAKQAREAAFRKLVSQGYSCDVASSAARRWIEEGMGASD